MKTCKYLLFVFSSVVSVSLAAVAEPLKLPGAKEDHRIFFKASNEIARKEIDGCISHDEACKLNDEMRKINQQDLIYSQGRYHQTGDRINILAHDPAKVIEARKIYDYLQTKTVVNEKWRSPSAGMGPHVVHGSEHSVNHVTRGSLIRP